MKHSSRRSVEDRNQLVQNNLGLVGMTVNRLMKWGWIKRKLTWDEAFSAGCMGLLRASECYQEDHDTKSKFSTYAVPVIRFWVIQEAGMTLLIRPTFASARDYKDKMRGRQLSEFTASPKRDSLWQWEDCEVLRDAVKRMFPREREMLTMRYGLGDEVPHTLKEIGDRLNMSRERVRQLLKRAENRLREAIGASCEPV